LWLSGQIAPSARANPKIASINLCSDQFALALAERGDILAVTQLAADPSRSAEAARAVGLPVTQGTAEEIAALKPDLVLADSFSDPNTVVLIRQFGIKVIILPSPTDFASIIATTRLAARAIGAVDRGESIVAEIEGNIAIAQDVNPNRPVVAALEPGGYTQGAGTLLDDAIARAGGLNLARRLALNGYRELPLEWLVAADIDLMIMPHDTGRTASLSLDALRHPAILERFAGTPVLALPANLTDCPAPASASLVPRIRRALGALSSTGRS